MPTTLSQEQLKTQLQELIDNSAALKSLPPAARNARVKLMLSADPDTMQKFIEVFENEATQLKKIDDEFQKDAATIQDLIAEVKHLEVEANTVLRKEAEKEEHAGDVKKAEALLKQLDEIAGEK